MADVHSKEVRSYNMSRIRSENTKPEMLVRKFLHARGYRYKLHDKTLPGKPDIVLPKHKTVIFVHGCFWHGHKNCRYASLPKTRTDWWMNKIGKNKSSDAKQIKQLKTLGWCVITLWECDLKSNKQQTSFDNLLTKLN